MELFSIRIQRTFQLVSTYHWNVVTSQMRSYMIILVFRRPVGLFMVNCVFVSVIKELEKGVYN